MGLEKLPQQRAPWQSFPEREANRKMAEQPEKQRDFLDQTVRMQSRWKPVSSWRCLGHHQSTSAPLSSKHTYTLCFCHMTMRHLTPLSPHRGDLHAEGNIWSQLARTQILMDSGYNYFNDRCVQVLKQNLGILDEKENKARKNKLLWCWFPVQALPRNPGESFSNCHIKY